ncbi:MAG: hypothetical protein AAFV80_15425, partial [Bacteroidota bacterium]
IKLVMLGDEQGTMAYSGNGNSGTINMRYNELNDEHYKTITAEVRTFIEMLFEVHNQFDFSKNFGVNSSRMDFYRGALTRDLLQYLKDGLDRKRHKDLSGDLNASIEESLFFYPLVGALNQLATTIVGD